MDQIQNLKAQAELNGVEDLEILDAKTSQTIRTPY